MVKISVIVPVYNTGDYLRRCLDSLLFQSLKELEIVVVNDGSTDNSPQIIEEYKEKYPNRIKYFSKENGGQGSARNLAFKYCEGEYIGFLDSDDFVEKDMFEKMYNAAKENDADYVGCGFKSVEINDDKVVSVVQDYVGRKNCKTNREMFIDSLVNMFTSLYKRSVLEQSKVLFPENFFYEDTSFYVEVIPWIKKMTYINEPLACRTIREGSTMSNLNPERIKHMYQAIDHIIEFFKNNGIYEEYKNEITYFCCKVLLCSFVNRISFVKLRRDRKKLVKETYAFVKERFGDFRKNPYLKKKPKHIYIKLCNRPLLGMAVGILHIRFLIRKDYLS